MTLIIQKVGHVFYLDSMTIVLDNLSHASIFNLFPPPNNESSGPGSADLMI